jgi:hypothetical protein
MLNENRGKTVLNPMKLKQTKDNLILDIHYNYIKSGIPDDGKSPKNQENYKIWQSFPKL